MQAAPITDEKKTVQRFVYLVLAALAGSLATYTFAPYRLYWLMPLSLIIPIILSETRPKHAFLIGYVWGFSAYLALFYWIYISIHDVGGMPILPALFLTALLPAYLALYPALALWLTLKLSRHTALRWLVFFPACWTLSEWLRGWLLTGFPWGQIAYSQMTESPLAGFTPLTGIYGITFLVALSAGAGFVFFSNRRLRWRISIALSLALCWALGAGLKEFSWTHPVGRPIKVALAQGNIAQQMKWDARQFSQTLQLYAKQVSHTHADLMILPETALPGFIDQLPTAYLDILISIAQHRHLALASGVLRWSDDKTKYFNAVVALSDKNLPFYAKNHLVPFGEFIPLPFLTGWIYRFMNIPLTGFSRGGPKQAPLALAGQKIAFNVCYEDSFGEELIGQAAQATMLANVSNLAWFGKSNAVSQHLQMSQARALETGRPLLRATNTGMTAIIRRNGEIEAIAAPFTQQVLTGYAQGYIGLTPYMRYGNTPLIVLCVLIIIGGGISRHL